MKVYDLIQQLDNHRGDMEVAALIWPDESGGEIKLVSVAGAALLNHEGVEKVVLRIATSL